MTNPTSPDERARLAPKTGDFMCPMCGSWSPLSHRDMCKYAGRPVDGNGFFFDREVSRTPAAASAVEVALPSLPEPDHETDDRRRWYRNDQLRAYGDARAAVERNEWADRAMEAQAERDAARAELVAARELLGQARAAMKLAKESHGMQILTLPPKDCWIEGRVSEKLSDAIRVIDARAAAAGEAGT